MATEHNPENKEYNGAQLVFTAGTMYTNPADPRFEAALGFAENAHAANIPFVIVDNSPLGENGKSWVVAALQERKATVVRAEIGGIATQRQQGVAYAVTNGAMRVVGTEAEKPDLV